jgi:hypothetical protein
VDQCELPPQSLEENVRAFIEDVRVVASGEDTSPRSTEVKDLFKEKPVKAKQSACERRLPPFSSSFSDVYCRSNPKSIPQVFTGPSAVVEGCIDCPALLGVAQIESPSENVDLVMRLILAAIPALSVFVAELKRRRRILKRKRTL